MLENTATRQMQSVFEKVAKLANVKVTLNARLVFSPTLYGILKQILKSSFFSIACNLSITAHKFSLVITKKSRKQTK